MDTGTHGGQASRAASKASRRKNETAGEKASRLYRLTNQLDYGTVLADGFYDPGRDSLDLPPLASFYRHNNFGREVITVDKAADADLALAAREACNEVCACTTVRREAS